MGFISTIFGRPVRNVRTTFRKKRGFSDLLDNVNALRTTKLQPWALRVMIDAEQVCVDTISYLDERYTSEEWRIHKLGGVLVTIEKIIRQEEMTYLEEEITQVWNDIHDLKVPDLVILRRVRNLVKSLISAVVNFGKV